MPKEIRPQAGPQTMFLKSDADIVVYGGAAGGGKSWGLLLEAIRNKKIRGFNATIFRTQFTDLVKPGSLWEESYNLYSDIKRAYPKLGDKQWIFLDKKGNITSKVTFAYVNEQNLATYKGSQLCMIGYDELCDFSEKVFFFMLSRNRSTCGVIPYIRATCNPDPDSWVAKFIEWWIDPDTGYAIPERSGVVRWMIRRDEKIYWADTKEELCERFHLVTDEEKMDPRSVTFIASSVYDNKELLKVNPQYLGNLKAMGEVDRERFLRGNWKIKPASGLYFKRSQVTMLEKVPDDIQYLVRAWDLAATEKKESNDPDYTSGVLMGRRKNGNFVVLDVVNQQIKAGDVERLIRNTSLADRAKYGRMYWVRLPIDPGAAGKIVADSYVKLLTGFAVETERVTGSKILRATPFATQWQNGNVEVLIADWNEMYFSQMEFFPESKHDDMVDASSDSFNELAKKKFSIRSLI